MHAPNTAAVPAASETTPSTLRAHVVKVLRGEILSGKYQPGDRLNESRSRAN